MRYPSIIDESRIFDKKYPSRWRALKCLEGDSQITGLLKRDPVFGQKIETICEGIYKHTMNTLEEEPEAIIADHRYGYIAGITKKAVKRKIESRLNFSDKIDKVLTNRFLGPLLMIAILYGMYSFTFWASEMPILWLEAIFDSLKSTGHIGGPCRDTSVTDHLRHYWGCWGRLRLCAPYHVHVLCHCRYGGFGLYGPGCLYAGQGVALVRAAWQFRHGLVVSGGISGGCAVPGVMATRILRDPKERIATLLVVPFMNCGAKLPVYAMLIGAFFSKDKARMMFLLTLLSWGFALFAAKIIRATILRGPNTPFVMELPPYRAPTIRRVLDSYMGKDLAVYQKGRYGHSGLFRAPVGHDDLSGTHQRPDNLL